MTRADTLTVPRFVGRKEYFGSVFFDRDNHRILPFDKASTLLLWNAPCPREELHQAFRAILTAEGTDQFLSRWTEAGLLTPQGALNARCL
ncbi:MAG: hypothetical protein HYU64_03020 [Armatimonadetes bacterium]|nr:hypothetical protein [Armatimonadota bacterium]